MKEQMKKKAPLLLAVIVIAAVTAFAGCQPQSPVRQEVQPQTSPEPTVAAPQPQEQVPEDLKGAAEYTIRKQLGEKSKTGNDRIRSLSIEGSGSESEVIIELNGNDAFSGNMTIRGMLMDCKKILEPLSKRQDLKSVSVSEYLDVEEIGGGTVAEWVFTLTLDRKGLDRIASGDYLLNDMTDFAKEYKIHPNFMK